jgi:hypothetical protein
MQIGYTVYAHLVFSELSSWLILRTAGSTMYTAAVRCVACIFPRAVRMAFSGQREATRN